MLRCETISKSYGGEPLFEKISFTIGSGEKIALVGRNGSGKTTIFRLLSGEETPDSGIIARPPGYRIGLLAQHAHFHHSTILDEAASVISSTDTNEAPADGESSSWKAKKMLSGLGFSLQQFEEHPSSLPGGFTLRLQLAKLLLSNPDLLLLDEPTNYLDITTVRWLTQFLRGWKKELIAISHDRAFLDSISTHTMGLHRGNLTKILGKTSDYFTLLLQKEELHMKAVEKQEEEREKLTNFINRFGAKATKAKQAQSRKKRLHRLPELEELERIQSLSFFFQEAPTHAKLLVEVSSLSFAYPGQHKKPLFSDLSFSLSPGDRLAIAGKNGAGKSTLLKVLRGELAPISGRSVLHPSCKIGYFGQTNIDRMNLHNTIEEEISLSNPTLTTEEIRSLMGVMMLTKQFHSKKIGVLSGGEKSRVLLAKILASPTNLLLLDEPTNHLDVESIESLSVAIEEFQGAVLLVSHSEDLLERLSTACLIFDASSDSNSSSCARYYPMGYELFLSEIGWKEEQQKSNQEKNISHSSSDRHKRALLVQERSKAIKPIKAKIQKIEDQLLNSETTKASLEAELIELVQMPKYASGSGSHTGRMGTLQKEIYTQTLEIERLYKELETAEIELQEIEARFSL